jgi:hypothetical protein
MTELKIMCPDCTMESTITDSSVRRAMMLRSQTKGFALIACPNCAHVLKLDQVPAKIDDVKVLDEWIAQYDIKVNDSWLPCLPLLDPMNAKMPNGYVKHLNVKYWTPGDDTQAIPAIQYMLKYGIEPELAWAMMGHT